MKKCIICGEEFEGSGEMCEECALDDYRRKRAEEFWY